MCLPCLPCCSARSKSCGTIPKPRTEGVTVGIRVEANCAEWKLSLANSVIIYMICFFCHLYENKALGLCT